MADGKLRINASAFYYDYKDYQSFTVTNLVQAIGNLDATVKGLELELAAKPVRGLDARVSVSLLDATVYDVVLPSGRIVDRNMPLAPDFSLNGVLRYEWDALGGTLSAQTDFVYSGDYAFTVLAAPLEQEDAYLRGNVRLGYRIADYEFSAFVKNVTNERHRDFALDISALGFSEDRWAPPRWFGASVAYRW